MDNRKPLDAATEMTVAWIQSWSAVPEVPDKEKVAAFFREMYKTVSE